MHIPRIVTGILASFLLLTGCTPATTAPPQAAEQSVLDACASLAEPMSEASNTLQSAITELATDPSKAVQALQGFQSSFEQAIAPVTNPEVKAQTEKALAATKAMVEALDAGVKDPTKMAGIDQYLADFQTEMTGIGEVCGG